MRMTLPLSVDVPEATINITLPTGTPLMCDADTAEKQLGLSRKTLDALRRQYPDFPARCVGRSVRYLLPDVYAWFRDFPGGNIPIE